MPLNMGRVPHPKRRGTRKREEGVLPLYPLSDILGRAERRETFQFTSFLSLWSVLQRITDNSSSEGWRQGDILAVHQIQLPPGLHRATVYLSTGNSSWLGD